MTTKEFFKRYAELSEDAEKTVVKLIRKALSKKENKHISHCVLSNGYIFFCWDYSVKGKNNIITSERNREIAPELFEFVDSFNEVFKISGWGWKVGRKEIIKSQEEWFKSPL